MTLEQAWAAGLFDGEGSVSHDRLQLKMVDGECVERFQAAVDAGRVYGPYANRSGERDGYQRSDFYMWVALKDDRFHVAHMLYPMLSRPRREAIDRLYGPLEPLSL